MNLDNLFDEIHALLREGEHEQVVRLLIGNGHSIESPYNQDKNHAWYILGDLYYRQENYNEAVSAFKYCLEDRPEDIEAMLALANCYSEMGLPEKSEKVLKQAQKSSPNNPFVIYNLANALFDQCEYDKAVDLYKLIGQGEQEVFELAKKNIKRAKKLCKNKSR